MNKKGICERYFNGMNPKHLMAFETDTPQKNHIKGYICKKHNYFLGSLYITEVNGKKTGQFVQGFPKIHYPEPNNKYYTYEIDEYQECIYLYEKIDGTNIVFYGLQNHYGGIIEIVPKTRNMPIADKVFLSMMKILDLEPIEDIFEGNGENTSVAVELYGIRNQHEIYYYDTYLKMVLLGIYYDNDYGRGWIGSRRLDRYSYGIERPKNLFKIIKNDDKFMLLINPDNWLLQKYYQKYFYNRFTAKFPKSFENIDNCFNTIKVLLQMINDDYYKKHKRLFIEGVVAFGQNDECHDFYTKIKPKDIEEKHRQSDQVSSKYIRKEIYKYFDEYGSQIKELYEKDDKHYYNYVIENLREHCTEEQINHPQTKKKIEKLFFEKWNAVTIPESMQKICETIVLENPGRETSELMSIFARKHPEKKKVAKDVFVHMDAINKKHNGD